MTTICGRATCICTDKFEKSANGSKGHMLIRAFSLEYGGEYRSEMVHYKTTTMFLVRYVPKSVLKTDGQLEYRACSLWLLMSLLEPDGVSPVLDVRLHVKSMSCHVHCQCPFFQSSISRGVHSFSTFRLLQWHAESHGGPKPSIFHSLEPQVASGITKWQFLYRKNSFARSMESYH